MGSLAVGIPRALLFYKYEWLWRTFFERLGCRVVVSPETNRRILQDGLALAVDETCLPVKVLLGHVAWLKDRADCVFIPSVASVHHGETVCSKLWGLHDIVRNTFPDLKLLGCRVDAHQGRSEWRAFLELGRAICPNPVRVAAAYRHSKRVQSSHDRCRVAQQAESTARVSDDALTLLLVAHPYTLRDGLLGRPILDFLRRDGVRVVFSDSVDVEDARRRSSRLSRDLYWTYSKEFLGAADAYKDRVNGIVYVMSFPCGPDSLVVELALRRLPDVPSLVLTLDELQGDIGLVTRLESFTDILRRRARCHANA